MSKSLKNAMGIAAHVEDMLAVHLLLVNNRHEKIDRHKQQSPTEARWCDTDNRERMLVQLNRPSDHVAIVLETAVPIRVAEHEIGGTVRAVLVGTVEETAEVRPKSK